MPIQHHLPSKVYYLDRLGNMSTSSCLTNTTGSTSSVSSSATLNAGVRKQILPLKPKQTNSYVQHLEIKGKDASNVPVTMLELKKKKEKSEKNVVTNLVYRKPSTFSTGSSDHHYNALLDASVRRPGSPPSSGYETDSLHDQENCDVFSNLLSSYHDHELDMLHSHPIWSPQATLNNNSLLMPNSNLYGFH